jgi:hypothetical protein
MDPEDYARLFPAQEQTVVGETPNLAAIPFDLAVFQLSGDSEPRFNFASGNG